MEIKHRIQFGSAADELAEKVLTGEKIATSSLYDYYNINLKEKMNENEYAYILDSHGREICIIQIKRIEIIEFQNVTEQFAMDEGDGNLANWLKIHTEYYSFLLTKIGKNLTGETKLLCEWFSVVTLC